MWLFALVSAYAAPGIEGGEPLMRNYSANEYKGDYQIWAIVQDQRGVMYFGTSREILEFDGKNWKRLEVANKSIVRSLAMDKEQRIYVGASGEFGYLAADSRGEKKVCPHFPQTYSRADEL